jgi:hypothetical protein
VEVAQVLERGHGDLGYTYHHSAIDHLRESRCSVAGTYVCHFPQSIELSFSKLAKINHFGSP